MNEKVVLLAWFFLVFLGNHISCWLANAKADDYVLVVARMLRLG